MLLSVPATAAADLSVGATGMVSGDDVAVRGVADAVVAIAR